MQRRELERLQNEAGAELNEEERGVLRKLADRLKAFAGYLRDGLKRLGRGDRATRAALEAKAEDVYALAEMLESATAMTAAELRQAGKITNAPPAGETKLSSDLEETDRIEAGMNDETRTEILKRKIIEEVKYDGSAESFIAENEADIENRKKSTVQNVLFRAVEKFGIELPTTISNDEYQIEASMSSKTLRESAHKNEEGTDRLVRLLPILQDVIRNAVGIEIHANRYFADSQTRYFLNLLGGYTDGDMFIPIRFGLKANDSGYTLYVIFSDEGIKRTEVLESPSFSVKEEKDDGSRSVNLNIAQIAAHVKIEDILEYLPDGLLSKSQLEAKRKAISDTVKYTADKNDLKYAKFLAAR